MPLFLGGAVRALAPVVLLAAGPARAHEGHDHAPPPAPASAAAARAEASSDLYELVAVRRGDTLLVYLDRFLTNEPVEGATIGVETPDGPVAAQAAPGEPYRVPAPWLARPGRYDLLFTVTAPPGADVLPATLEVPKAAPAAAAPPASRIGSALADARERLARQDSALLAAALGGFLLGLAVMALGARRRAPAFAALLLLSAVVFGTAAFAHEGEDHGDAKPAGGATPVRDVPQRLADGVVFLPKPTQRILAIRTTLTQAAAFRRTVELPGRVIPDPNASGLVQASTGGRLSPPPNGFPRLGTPVKKGEPLAYVMPPLQAVDVSDMRQRQGELDQQIAILERRVARYESLARTGAGTLTQLDEARLELQGLKERRAALDRSRREPEALVAPVSGVVAEANATAGQMAQPSERIFQIVDPARLWVEALSFDALAGAGAATARTSTGRVFPLVYRGSGFADRNQAVPVHFALEGDLAGLRAGQFVTVLAPLEEERRGFALPRASLVRSASGQDIVYEHTGAERFEPREVRVEPLDGERVLVAAGVGPAKRIVTQGAELLEQVR